MATNPILEGYGAITPYPLVPEVSNLIEFLQRAYGAIEMTRGKRTDGSIIHAEVRIDGAPVMLGEPTADFGPMPGAIYLYVTDCDSVYQRAMEVGGASIMPPTTMPSRERYGGVKDPSGNIWWIASRVEDCLWMSKADDGRNTRESKSDIHQDRWWPTLWLSPFCQTFSLDQADYHGHTRLVL